VRVYGLLAAECQREILELDLLVTITRIGEELFEQVADVAGSKMVEIVLTVAAESDQTNHAHEGQVMADGWLRLTEEIAEGGYVEFAILGQSQDNFEARLVGEELEDVGQTMDRRVRDFDGRGRAVRAGLPGPGFDTHNSVIGQDGVLPR